MKKAKKSIGDINFEMDRYSFEAFVAIGKYQK